MFERWYQRLGPRYPRIALLVALSGAGATGVIATAGTALYIDMSAAEIVRLSLASWLLVWAPEFVIAGRLCLRAANQLAAWVRGSRDAAETAKAWQAATNLPISLVRDVKPYLAVVPGIVLWGLYARDQLDLPGYSVFVFIAASTLVYLYWVAVRFLGVEMHLRPLVDDIGRQLPQEFELQPVRINLRWRLLASLVAVILITGIAVGGFAAGGGADIRALGFSLLGSAIAAAVVSSWLIGLLSASITRPITRLRDAAEEVGRGDLKVRVPLTSTDESGELTQAFNRMVIGLEQRERLREAFGTFVDPELADRVAEQGTDLRGEELEVSILFMDVRGFTRFAEQKPAPEVVAKLNELYELVVPVILRHGGHANKFIGDGLLAVFGAPERHEDHADRAVAAAGEIAECVADQFGDELGVGVGVNSGSVVVGTIGGGGRLDFTVIGDVVNTASRAESATRETGDVVLITGQTLSRLSEADGWKRRSSIPLKGKTEEIELFAPGASAG